MFPHQALSFLCTDEHGLTRTKGSIKAVLQKRNRVMNRAIVLEVLIYIFKYHGTIYFITRVITVL